MTKFDRKKFREELRKKEQEAMSKNPYEDFEGTKTELFFLKLGHIISKNKFLVLGCLLGLVAIIFTIIGVDEYLKYRDEQASIEIEKIEKKHKKEITIPRDDKIKDYEDFLANHSAKSTSMRVLRALTNLYIEKSDYLKAAESMQKVASMVEDPKEMQAYCYLLAGNYFEMANANPKALENYTRAVGLIANNRDVPTMNAWAHYGSARMKLAEGQKDGALADLKKILDIEAKYEGPYLEEVKRLATYLILKTNKG